MVASVEERFQAAVNVIKGLPKNGPYQPSTSTMLNFYGLYKQATEGSCFQKRPGFWDVVGRAKWDAWNSNGHLSKEKAMLKYVENLREIIETMSFTSNVQNFVGSISGLDNINLNELDMVAPGMRELAESHPNSPFNSRTNSPHHGNSSNAHFPKEQTTVSSSIMKAHNEPMMNGYSDGDFDTMENCTTEAITHASQFNVENCSNTATNVDKSEFGEFGNVDQSDDEYCDPVDMNRELTDAIVSNSDLLKQVQATVLKMNDDLLIIINRTNSLENTVQNMFALIEKGRSITEKRQNHLKWWPFNDISPLWFTVLIIWPFVLKRLSGMLVDGRRK